MGHYPIWKHHKEHGGKLVQSEEHLKSLGEGWGDSSAVWRPHLIKPDELKAAPINQDPAIQADEDFFQDEPAEPGVQKGRPGRKPNAAKKVSI